MADRLYVDESFDRATYLMTIRADTRRELSARVKEFDVGHAKMLRAYRSGPQWVGLVQIVTSTLEGK
jgi:hypothetical protein